MHLYELFSETELAAQIDSLMVKATQHAGGRLTIFNYTKRAQYTPELWNHVTDKCRGLIVDSANGVVARPFEKFWNLDDPHHPETLFANLPTSVPLLTRKMDGSLGIGYPLDGRWFIATRGSFVSEQAVWASEWLASNSPSLWPVGWTPLFEIVYPENQIVVRYQFSGLVLLALVDIETGEEVSYAELQAHGARNRIPVVEALERPLSACLAEDIANEEGYVAAWPRAGRTPLRCKIKFANYVRLHRLLTGTNAITVWEMLRDGLDVAALTVDVPSDFRVWIDSMVTRFETQFREIEASARAAYDAYPGGKNPQDAEQKKAFALYVQVHAKEHAAILFAMISGKDYAPIIWKGLRPTGEESTFKSDGE